MNLILFLLLLALPLATLGYLLALTLQTRATLNRIAAQLIRKEN